MTALKSILFLIFVTGMVAGFIPFNLLLFGARIAVQKSFFQRPDRFPQGSG
jgi:hypothetical protein